MGDGFGEGEQVTFTEVPMPKLSRAVVTHRAVLAATRAAFARWLASSDERREVVAGILRLLAECAKDTTGDKTLDVLSEIFEAHDAEEFPDALADHLVALAESAHAIGKSRTLQIER